MGPACLAITNVLIWKRKKEIRNKKKRRRHCEHEGIDWSGVAVSEGPRAAPEVRRGQAEISPQSLLRERRPAHTLILVHWSWFWISGFKSFEKLDFCCFKPRNFEFVTEASGSEYSVQIWGVLNILIKVCMFKRRLYAFKMFKRLFERVK